MDEYVSAESKGHKLITVFLYIKGLFHTLTEITDIICYFQRDPPIEVRDLFTDIQDGRILMALLEELSGCKLVRIQTEKLNDNSFDTIFVIKTIVQHLSQKTIVLSLPLVISYISFTGLGRLLTAFSD